MRLVLLLLTLFFSVGVSADFIGRCDPPQTKTALEAANKTAGAIRRHLINIDQIKAGTEPRKRILPTFGFDESLAIVRDHSRMCYQFFRPNSHICNYSVPASSTVMPAPAVCAWSRLSASEQGRVRALGAAPE